MIHARDSYSGGADMKDGFEDARKVLRFESGLRHPLLREAAQPLEEGRFGIATKLLRKYLASHPDDARAQHLLSEIARWQSRTEEQLQLLTFTLCNDSASNRRRSDLGSAPVIFTALAAR